MLLASHWLTEYRRDSRLPIGLRYQCDRPGNFQFTLGQTADNHALQFSRMHAGWCQQQSVCETVSTMVVC